MSGTLIDSNIRIGLFAADPERSDWSRDRRCESHEADHLAINPVNHAEVKGFKLQTRDPTRDRQAFPTLQVIAPDTRP